MGKHVKGGQFLNFLIAFTLFVKLKDMCKDLLSLF